MGLCMVLLHMQNLIVNSHQDWLDQMLVRLNGYHLTTLIKVNLVRLMQVIIVASVLH